MSNFKISHTFPQASAPLINMPQSEFVPGAFKVDSTKDRSSPTAVYLRSVERNNSFNFSLQVVRPNLFRTTFTSNHHPLPPHPSAHLLEHNIQGAKTSNPTASSKRIEVGDVLVDVDWRCNPSVSLSFAGSDIPIHHDLPPRSYAIDGTGIAHYTRYKRGTLHVGLGEKPAPMDLSNRHFVLSATDCFGYDVYRTDPMYKHIPLLINATPEGCVGIFSTSHARGFYSVGSEMDGLWGHFKVYRQEHGGLEEYLIVGRTLNEVVRTYADLVGYPLLVPRWAFGYIAGGMKYSMLDEPRACDALLEFAHKMKEHDIPCSAFQMSSGYTVAETEPKTRNVFTWNKHRFPDPQGFIDEYHRQGIRLIANVKPYVLSNHPGYEKLRAAGALFTDPGTKQSATARLWSAGGGESGVGGHIDFTSAVGFKWWFDGIRELKKLGIDSIWNDNNEYTIPDDYWECALDEPCLARQEHVASHVGLWGRSLNTELMAKSSHDATVEVEPNKRPFVLTRSATAGTMRYCASSWSGDNVTSWKGMKGANALSLTAGMCLLQCYGHDIGGFEGPQPTPELLVRWIQLGIYSSRFAINCFKTSPDNNNVGEVIEPWMFPSTTDVIRRAIKRRYELIPYLYSLALESHTTASPPQRWTGWGYESDPEVWKSPTLTDGETQYWLGDSILIGGVYEPGVSSSRIYLPKGTDGNDTAPQYLNLNAPYQYLSSGEWHDIGSKWDESIPVIAKVGGAVPVGKPCQTLSAGEDANPAELPADDYRAVEIFPGPGNSGERAYSNSWYEDDGISPAPAKISTFVISYGWSEAEIRVAFEQRLQEGYSPAWKGLSIILPAGDKRDVYFDGHSDSL